jgi:hypothetical protein
MQNSGNKLSYPRRSETVAMARKTSVTTQDFINFWGKFFAFVLLEMIEFSQEIKTF